MIDQATPRATTMQPSRGAFLRSAVIGLTAFLTLVDLFAAQAILPSLAALYGVGPADMGFAVNSSTIGMAVSGLVVALFSPRIDRRNGVLASLALLSIPTALLAVAPDLTTFSMLRIAQGIFMSGAFTLTLAYLGERCGASDAAGAFAAYITGNVASNLIGRMISAATADHFGLAANFYLFAALNVSGAILVYFTIERAPRMAAIVPVSASWRLAAATQLRNRALRAGFAIGFLILFIFIGTFTYVNFELTSSPFGLSAMSLGAVYLVFLPALFTTPLAGRVVGVIGFRYTLWLSLGVTFTGLPLLGAPLLTAVLAGMVLVAVGTFFAQATATGFVSLAATSDRGVASGVYLASYFAGGLAGSAVLGRIYETFGWHACLMGIGISVLLAALCAVRLVPER